MQFVKIHNEAAARGSKVLLIKDGTIHKLLVLGKYEDGKKEEREARLEHFLREGENP